MAIGIPYPKYFLNSLRDFEIRTGTTVTKSVVIIKYRSCSCRSGRLRYSANVMDPDKIKSVTRNSNIPRLTIITEYQRYRGLLSVSIKWRCFLIIYAYFVV